MARAKARKISAGPVDSTPKPHLEATPERLRHAANDTETVKANIDKAGERALLTRRFRDSHIERMFAAKRITEAQANAARWYLEQWALSGIPGRVVANYSPDGGGQARCIGSKLLGSERQYLARMRWREARSHIPHNMVAIVDMVALHNEVPAFGHARYRERFAQHVGKGLDPLAKWLGYAGC